MDKGREKENENRKMEVLQISIQNKHGKIGRIVQY